MVNELKSGYEWCLEERIRLLNLSQWPTKQAFFADSYYEEKITFSDFSERIANCDFKRNSNPRKTELFLEYRMYGFVNYNLSDIQKGIQFAHAVVEYGQYVKDIPPFEAIYNKFAKKDKTFIILNGGTTNENPERLGTLQQYAQLLKDNQVLVAEFREPDLNDTLTAVVFLVDERVSNRELYPDFVRDENATDARNEKQYDEWFEKIGNEQNVFLRSFLPKFRLA